MQRQLQEIQALATKYSKADLGRMVQLGLLDPQKAMMAGMMIQRIEQQNAKPPQSTVAQEVLGLPTLSAGPMQPTPQLRGSPGIGNPPAPPLMMAESGVEGLPAGNVGNYAGGGIVAFDEGGEVPGYNGEDGSFINYGIPISYGGIAGGEDFFNKPAMPYGEQMRNVGSSLINALRRIVSDPSLDEKDRAAAKAKLEQISPTYPDESRRGAATFTRPTDTIVNPVAPPPPAPPAAGKGAKGPAIGGRFSKLPGIEAPSTSISVPEIKGEFYDAPTPKELGGYGKERTDYMQSMGVDPEMYDKMIKGVEEKKGKVEKRKGEAKGEALMMAGLGLIGARRGQEFQALGESARAALSAYKQDVKELRAAEEKYDERIDTLRMADQQAKQTGAEKDIARRDAAMDKVETAKMERSRAQTELNKTQATLQNSANVAGLQAKSQIFNTLVSAQTQREVAQLNADVQKWVHSRPPAEIQAIDIYAQRTGKPFAEAAKEFYGARYGARNQFTKEEAMKQAMKNLSDLGIINPTEAQVQAEMGKLERIYSGGGGGGGTLRQGANGSFDYVPGAR